MKEIPKLIFGKARLVKDEIFDEIGYDKGAYIAHPAISGGWCKAEVNIQGNTPVHPFSSGTDFMGWTDRNCDRCAKKNMNASTAMAIRTQGGCPLELRLAISYIDNGCIPFKTAKRIGYDEITVREKGIGVSLGDCKEKVNQ